MGYKTTKLISRRQVVQGSVGITVTLSTGSDVLAQDSKHSSKRNGGGISAIRVGSPVTVPNNFGDTWVTAWADDGNLYTPADDTLGFGIPAFLTREQIRRFQADEAAFEKQLTANEKAQFDRLMGPINFNRVEGDDPLNLRGTTVNRVDTFVALDRGRAKPDGSWTGSPDGRSWKSSGCSFIDGALYWVVARHKYPGSVDAVGLRQEAANASIIKSTDYGKNWSRSALNTLNSPMFPGSQFATPYFVEYGRNSVRVDGANRYIYAVSNNGYWDNGDVLILGRVRRDRIGLLDGSDWQFFTGGDGLLEVNWTPNAAAAKPIIEKPGRLGMTGVAYLPARQRYMMVGWYYPGGSGYLKGSSTTTTWDFYEAPKPWGPWSLIHSHTWKPQGYYTPGICPKFQTADRVFITTAGDFNNWWDYYHLTVVPIDIS